MIPTRLSLLCLACVLAATPVEARLGDTADQCAERYGEPRVGKALAPAELKHIYKKEGLEIQADFMDGNVAAILYRKTTGKAFEPLEIEAFLKENGGGEPWGEPIRIPSPDGKARWWRRKDRSAQSMKGGPGGQVLLFMTSDLANGRAEVFRAKQRAKAKGKDGARKP